MLRSVVLIFCLLLISTVISTVNQVSTVGSHWLMFSIYHLNPSSSQQEEANILLRRKLSLRDLHCLTWDHIIADKSFYWGFQPR